MNETDAKNNRPASKLVWLPFAIVFVTILSLLVFSFVDGPVQVHGWNLNVKFGPNETSHSYIQLAVLIILLFTTLALPGWFSSVKKSATAPKYNYALGLPKGSIRGIVVLIAIAGYTILAIKQGALDSITQVLLLILVFYFSAEARVGNHEEVATVNKNNEEKTST